MGEFVALPIPYPLSATQARKFVEAKFTLSIKFGANSRYK